MAKYDPVPYVRPSRKRDLRLADLYLRQGEQQADAERRSGEIRAHLWGNVGQAVGQTATALIEAPNKKREQDRLDAESAQRRELGDIQIGQARRGVNDQENFDLAMTAGSRQKTLDALKDRPELYEKAQGHFTKIDTTMKQLLGDTAAGIADFGYTPEAAMAAMDDLLDQGFDERKIAPFRQAIQQNPESVKQIVNGLLSQSPDPRHQQMAKPQPLVELNKDTSLFDPNKGQVVAEGPKSPAPPVPREPNPTEASLALKAAAGDPAAQKALALMRAQRAEPRPPVEPLVAIMGPDGQPVLVPRSEATGKRPASNREQGRAVTSGDAGEIADFNTALDDIKTVREALSGNKATGTMAKAGAMAWNPISEVTGFGIEAKQKQAVIDRVKQVIGKALEGGVLRKEDELKYAKILPTIGDTPEVVTSKLDGLEKAIQTRKQRKIEALSDAGYDTGQFKAREAQTGRVYYDANGNPIKKP